MKTNIEQLDANIAKMRREMKIQGVIGALVFLALVAAAFALGYYTR